jgi:hypothetical protein
MPLAAGTRLGPYEIVSPLGVGGMGEVYRARDSRLKRDVALKVLPAEFAGDPDRLARFQREAELLAAINHQNIACIYGLENSEHLTGIVLELVEGETLADRLRRGPVAVNDALRMGAQIADALAAAHDKGVVHRDLKPQHVAITRNGEVKVLDFGLARRPHLGAGAADGSPTITNAALTELGAVLGTAAYMSPEQANGLTADRRSDIWAFGCVLYEMLTGQRAFEGQSVSKTLAGVLMKEPAWERLPAATPPAVGAFLRSCLKKPRDERVRDIGDVALALRGAFDVGGADGSRMRAQAPGSWHRTIVRGIAALVAASVPAAVVWFATRPQEPKTIRTEVTTTGASSLLINGFNRDLAITPDGSTIVYRGQAQLLVRALDRLEPAVLSGLGAPRGVFISPDGQWVGFFDGNTILKKVAITGGSPLTICAVDGSGSRGASWGPDGTIVFATNRATAGLQRVSAAGGTPTALTTPGAASGEGYHVWPEFLPGGSAILFTILPSTGAIDDAEIAVLDLATGDYRVLLRGGSHAHYVKTGHLLYGVSGTLRAVPFDLDRLEVKGTPTVVLEPVVTTSAGALDLVVAGNGTMVYVPGGIAGAAGSLVWVDRAGREEPLGAPVRAYTYPRISPDGTRVAVDIRDRERQMWTWDVARRTLTRLPFDSPSENYPTWSSDGKRIVATLDSGSATNIFWRPADGTGVVERLSGSPNMQSSTAMSPDGTRLVVGELRPATGLDLMMIPLQPRGPAVPLIETKFNELNAEFAPKGQWLAYESNESGREEVYVRPFPSVEGGKWQVSTSGGRTPIWSRDGRELFYLSSDNRLMGVRIEPGTSWRTTPPAQVLQSRYFEAGTGSPRTFDVARDGRFLMIKQDSSNAPHNLVVVQHWLEELQRRFISKR